MQIEYLVRRWHRAVSRYLPEREFMLRTDGRVWFLKISVKTQMFGLGLVLLLAGWGVFSSASFFISERVLHAKDMEILKSRLVYRTLLADVSDYQGKFSVLTDDLEKNHRLMLELVGKNAALQQNLMSAENKLVSSKKMRDEISNTKDNLKSELSSIQRRMRSLNKHNFVLEGNLSTVTGSLDNALDERNKAFAKNEKLEKTLASLKNGLLELGNSERKIIKQMTHSAASEIRTLERLVERTGLKVNKLIARIRKPSLKPSLGQGGPFVELGEGSSPAIIHKASIGTLGDSLERVSRLRNLVSSMPLSSPMDYFSISSHYGKRRDPINRRWAMHYGLDIVGPARANIYSTAKGIVLKAGRNGKYGKFVEIKHGNGFKTRYGHLRKILVKRGQAVEFRQKIGLMGNTGRSSGAHLHYEIVSKGRSRNPWRFIKAGRYVYKD